MKGGEENMGYLEECRPEPYHPSGNPHCCNEHYRQYRMQEELYFLKREMRAMQSQIRYYRDPNPMGEMKYLEEPKKTMPKLTALAKRMLDADTRALIKANILDKDLSITSEGRDILLGHYLQAHKKTLATEARKIVADKKKDEDE